jgi:hypothetical protein
MDKEDVTSTAVIGIVVDNDPGHPPRPVLHAMPACELLRTTTRMDRRRRRQRRFNRTVSVAAALLVAVAATAAYLLLLPR